MRQIKKKVFLSYFLCLWNISYALERVVSSVLYTYDKSHPCPLDLHYFPVLISYTCAIQHIEIQVLLLWINIHNGTNKKFVMNFKFYCGLVSSFPWNKYTLRMKWSIRIFKQGCWRESTWYGAHILRSVYQSFLHF